MQCMYDIGVLDPALRCVVLRHIEQAQCVDGVQLFLVVLRRTSLHPTVLKILLKGKQSGKAFGINQLRSRKKLSQSVSCRNASGGWFYRYVLCEWFIMRATMTMMVPSVQPDGSHAHECNVRPCLASTILTEFSRRSRVDSSEV